MWNYEKLLLSLPTRKYAELGLQQIKVLTKRKRWIQEVTKLSR